MSRYFKKYGPKQPVYLFNGSVLKFDLVDHDWGVLAIGNEGVIAEIEKCIQNKRGGIKEISKAEYEELLEKKKQPLKPRWREEISNAEMQTQLQIVQQRAERDRAAVADKPIPAVENTPFEKPKATRRPG